MERRGDFLSVCFCIKVIRQCCVQAVAYPQGKAEININTRTPTQQFLCDVRPGSVLEAFYTQGTLQPRALSPCLSGCLSTSPSVILSVCLSVFSASAPLSLCQPVSVCFSLVLSFCPFLLFALYLPFLVLSSLALSPLC